MKKTIAVLSGANMRDNLMAYKVGKSLAEYHCALLIDGIDNNSGLIAIANGAVQSGGQVIGISIMGQGAGQHVTDVIDCQSGLHFGAEMQMGLREGNFLSAHGFIMPFDADADSLSKLLAVIHFNRMISYPNYLKPVAILAYEDSISSWSDGVESMCGLANLTPRDLEFLKITSSLEEAIEWVVTKSVVIS